MNEEQKELTRRLLRNWTVNPKCTKAWRVAGRAIEIAKNTSWENIGLKKPNEDLIIAAAVFREEILKQTVTRQIKDLFHSDHKMYSGPKGTEWKHQAYIFREKGIRDSEIWKIAISSSITNQQNWPSMVCHTSEAYCIYDAVVIESAGAVGIMEMATNTKWYESVEEQVEEFIKFYEKESFTVYALPIIQKKMKLMKEFVDDLRYTTDFHKDQKDSFK